MLARTKQTRQNYGSKASKAVHILDIYLTFMVHEGATTSEAQHCFCFS